MYFPRPNEGLPRRAENHTGNDLLVHMSSIWVTDDSGALLQIVLPSDDGGHDSSQRSETSAMACI